LILKLKENSGLFGEKIWHLPRSKVISEEMEGGYSDLINSRLSPYGGAIEGAEFLAHFYEKGIDWVHVDMAGVVDNENLGHKANLKFANGWGVGTIMNFLKE